MVKINILKNRKRVWFEYYDTIFLYYISCMGSFRFENDTTAWQARLVCFPVIIKFQNIMFDVDTTLLSTRRWYCSCHIWNAWRLSEYFITFKCIHFQKSLWNGDSNALKILKRPKVSWGRKSLDVAHFSYLQFLSLRTSHWVHSFHCQSLLKLKMSWTIVYIH